MTINIEWQDQFGRWHHYQSKQNQADAYRVAQRHAESTGKRHRLVDQTGHQQFLWLTRRDDCKSRCKIHILCRNANEA